MTAYEDQEWIRLLKQGDEQALDHLFKALCEISVKICKSRDLDEQVAYEAAAQAYDRLIPKGIHSFVFRSKFSTFYYTIVSRELYRIMRRLKKYVDLPDDDQKLLQNIEARAGQILEILKICLDKLKERERTCLLKYYVLGDDPEDIAAELGISRTYVNVINHKARSLLKQCMELRGYASTNDVLGSLISL
jgi:RNA polymerase sigma factor (sigma-70 family)